jgi:molybdenum cofactor cytidylyltransferase
MFGLAGALPGRVVVTTTTRIFAAQMKLAPKVVVYEGEGPLALDFGLGEQPFVLVVGEVFGDKAHGIPAEVAGALIERPDVDYVWVEADGARRRPCKAPGEHEPVIPFGTTLVVPVVGIDAVGGRVGDVAHRPERVEALTGLGLDEAVTAEALGTLITHPNGGRKGVPVGARVVPLINKVETGEQLRAARAVARQVLEEGEIKRVVIGAIRQTHRPVVEVQRRVTAVVLAAGEGKRMGDKTKQLLPWGETTVLGQTLRNVLGSAVHDVIVVTGHEAEAVEAVTITEGARTIHNPDYAVGEMLSSLQVAVKDLDDGVAAVLVVLADQPMVETETLDKIQGAFWQGWGDLIAPVFDGKRGNPVLIGRRYFEELLALPVGAAPRDLVKRHLDELYLIEVGSDSILRDLDTVEAYERWRPEKC